MTDTSPVFVFLIDGKYPDESAMLRTLPKGLSEDVPEITYREYFRALEDVLRRGAVEPIRRSLEVLIGERLSPEQIREIRVDSVKHGALYDVAKVTVRVNDRELSMAMNSARHWRGRRALEREWHTFQVLAETPAAPYLPQPLAVGRTPVEETPGATGLFHFFLAQWFEGFHEWHMEKGAEEEAESVRVWDESSGGSRLLEDQVCGLLRGAAYVLTLALDREGFHQIYPWHHAAGDFIVSVDHEEVRVRLISARGRTVLVPPGSQRHERLSALAAFFFMLTFRMRLDRDQGTGELVWAPARWLSAVLDGFLRGWSHGDLSHEDFSTEEILSAFRAFDVADWETIGALLEGDLVVDAEEGPVVSRRVPEHARDLYRVLHA